MDVLLIGLLFLVLFFCGLILIARYNKKTIERTKLTLSKKGLKQQRLSCKQAVFSFFAKAFDFKSRASLSELWWVVFCISLPVNVVNKIWPMIGLFMSFLLFIPCLSLYVRRFRDVGLCSAIAFFVYIAKPIIEWIGASNFNGTWVLWFALLGLIVWGMHIWVVFRASDPFENKFGKIPNVCSVKSKHKTCYKLDVSIADMLRKIYFGIIKKHGNVRLLFVLGMFFAFVCMDHVYGAFTWHNNYDKPYSLLNFLWVIFWFYLPFLIIVPIKFISDGYSEDKRSK